MARIKPQALLQQSKKKKGPSRISVTTVVSYCLIVAVMVFFLFSTYRYWSQRSRIQTEEDGLSSLKGDNAFVDPKKSDIPRYAILKTSKGLITVELYKEGSPEVVDEFIDLCQKGHFKGMLFHRVIKNFVIQGGDSERAGATEDWTLRGKHNSHLESLKHEAFMLGTSKAKHDKEGFELFITTAPIPDLNEKVIVFGRVIKGEDVVQEIEEVDTDEHYRPKSPIRIISVSLKQKV
uniref:Peptidyl-prolyl cis-trans isomerase n=1 Tax=Davidia involucrata TaxID=16924 RepID=A0A5B6YIV4_DAVIN